jgi:6-phosphogluconolactonase
MLVISSNIALELSLFIQKCAVDAVERSGKFTIALSGGSLPKFLAALADVEMPWDKYHIFYADERCVPLDHPESNHRGAEEHFLSKVPIPRAQIFTINPNLVANPHEAAVDYEQTLLDVLEKSATGEPSFDLVLLGLGPDGHTCSLFPGHQLLEETSKYVSFLLDSPKPPPQRITLTFRALEFSREIAFVATGAGKADIIRQIIDEEVDYPSTRVCRLKEVSWFLDLDAAAQLSRTFHR